jgi:D-alanyl-D-alanine carboxypeptidase/D-alanyl-D-alanine-endopeptidase (penicillin-binding protein 4)
MAIIIKAFTPHHTLLRRDNHSFYKTGTLRGITTRVGYLLDAEENCYPFVVMLNDSDEKMQKVMSELRQSIP